MLHKLVFDTTDANTIADSHSVGAYLRSADGTLITHTTVGGKEALDVRIAEGINVAVDLTQADEVTVFQGTDPWIIADGGGSITVDATDLDIRALTQTDEITVFQGTDPWVVSATQLDIDDLNATDDAVQAWAFDGTGNAIGSTAGALDVYIAGSDPLTVNDAALANTAIANSANTLGVANTAEAVVASALTNRKYLFINNVGNRTVYIGSTGVSAANGFPVPPGSMMEMRAGAAVGVNWVGPNTSQEIRVLELA